jgi:hypothetical protein
MILFTAAVAISVLGHKALTAILYYLNSSLIPNTHKLIPNFAIEYATLGAKYSGDFFC